MVVCCEIFDSASIHYTLRGMEICTIPSPGLGDRYHIMNDHRRTRRWDQQPGIESRRPQRGKNHR